MAQRVSSTSVKQDASRKMEQGRAELDAEIQRMRVQLSPTRIAHSVVEHHSTAVLGTAFGIGLALPLLLFRQAHANPIDDLEKSLAHQEKPTRVSRKNSAARDSLLMTLAKTSAPFLLRWFMKSRLESPVPAQAPTPPRTQETDQYTPGEA